LALDIRKFGDPVLKTRAAPVESFDESLVRLTQDMLATMRDHEGVGLAATQVGRLKRVLVAAVEDDEYVIVNPVLTDRSQTTETATEGCLSIPGIQVDVERPIVVTISGQDVSGRPLQIEASDLLARVLQHEVDHLDGVLILDRTDRQSRKAAMREWREQLLAQQGCQDTLNIAYAGTPHFAASVLQGLISSPHVVGLVISQPNPRKGRGRRTERTPVAELAHSQDLLLRQPDSISEISDELSNYDALIIAAYGQILRPETLCAASEGAWNVHASLLPKYRGAAPVERAIMAGETETGVTIIRMDEGLDTGPMALQRLVAIPPEMDAGNLTNLLAHAGAKAIVEGFGTQDLSVGGDD
jgi:peptide deformylase